MCELCRNESESDFDDDYEDDDYEISMDDRWQDFYNWLDQLEGYELSELGNSSRGESAESSEAEAFLHHVRESVRSDFESGIDTDGVTDLRRRLNARDELFINARNAVESLSTHDKFLAFVDLGLYDLLDMSISNLDYAVTNVLQEFAVRVQGALLDKALYYESNDHSDSGLY